MRAFTASTWVFESDAEAVVTEPGIVSVCRENEIEVDRGESGQGALFIVTPPPLEEYGIG